MKSAKVALALVVLCAPALAVDGDPAKPAPAPAPAPGDDTKTEPKAPAAPAAKKERKVDEAATKALARYATLIAYPSAAGAKGVTAKAEFDQMGTTIAMDVRWSAEAGFDVDVVLSDEIKEQLAARHMDEATAKAKIKEGIVGQLALNQLFEAPGKEWEHYDVAGKQEGDDFSIALTPFDDKADADARTYTFGKDGLIKASTLSPKVDPDNPQSQMMAGQTLETVWAHKKHGEKNLLTSKTMSVMGMEIPSTFEYFEAANDLSLPKLMTISTPQGDVSVAFHDYTVDGKVVESTKTDAPKPAEKPAEKPADKPAGDPPAPAPVPPAPKDEPK